MYPLSAVLLALLCLVLLYSAGNGIIGLVLLQNWLLLLCGKFIIQTVGKATGRNCCVRPIKEPCLHLSSLRQSTSSLLSVILTFLFNMALIFSKLSQTEVDSILEM